jgi:hypothetical protein
MVAGYPARDAPDDDQDDDGDEPGQHLCGGRARISCAVPWWRDGPGLLAWRDEFRLLVRMGRLRPDAGLAIGCVCSLQLFPSHQRSVWVPPGSLYQLGGSSRSLPKAPASAASPARAHLRFL